LAELAAYLRQGSAQSEHLKTANQLYEKAIRILKEAIQNSDSPNHQASSQYIVNLLYSQGVLNGNANDFELATIVLAEALKISRSQEAINKDAAIQYISRCLWGHDEANPSLCSGLPSTLPAYSCNEYPILAIAKLGSANMDDLCKY
jgi:tetratricopeptide (TPR) repeat protein